MASRVTTNPRSRIWDLAGLNVMRIVIDPAQISFLLTSGFVGNADGIDLVVENAFTTAHHARVSRVRPRQDWLAIREALKIWITHEVLHLADGNHRFISQV